MFKKQLGLFEIYLLTGNFCHNQVFISKLQTFGEVFWNLFINTCQGKNSLVIFLPTFSVKCIAVIIRHPSFDVLSKQDELKSTSHSPLAWLFDLVAHLHESDRKETPACSDSTSKGECQKIATMHVILKAGVIGVLLFYSWHV